MAIYSGNSIQAIEYIQGTGKLRQSADGKQTFIFVVPVEDIDAWGVKSTTATRTLMLENWLGSQKACSKGYVITDRDVAQEHRVETIQGYCR